MAAQNVQHYIDRYKPAAARVAMLKSVGMTQGFHKMMDYECLMYGAKSLLWGLPAAVESLI